MRSGAASGEAGWTWPAGLTINRRSRAFVPGRARVAQLVEHATENRSVGGSIPPPGTILSPMTAPLTPLILFFRVHHFMDCADVAVPARPDLRRRCAVRQIATQKTLVGVVPGALCSWLATDRRRQSLSA